MTKITFLLRYLDFFPQNYAPLKCIENWPLGRKFSNLSDPSLSTRANATIENAIIQLDKSRSKNRVQGLKNRNSPLKTVCHALKTCFDPPLFASLELKNSCNKSSLTERRGTCLDLKDISTILHPGPCFLIP